MKNKSEFSGFIKAKPIWAEGREFEKNLTLGFRAVLGKSDQDLVVLNITASSIYRFFVNGCFQGHGPARGPHNYYRMDKWELSSVLKPGKNTIAIEVAAYNINSYYLLNQPGFLQAEIIINDKVLAYTSDEGGFEAFILDDRIQKVQRYSFQRPFVEAYRLEPNYDQWRYGTPVHIQPAKCSDVSSKNFLSRNIPYSEFLLKKPFRILSKGKVKKRTPKTYWKDRSLTDINSELGGYREKELEVVLSNQAQEIEVHVCENIKQAYEKATPVLVCKHEFFIVDFGINLTGFIGAHLTSHEGAKLLLIFDEILTDEDIDFKRLQCVNVISIEIKRGEYSVESFEPYTFRYLKVIVLEGSCSISELYLRELINPDAVKGYFECEDPILKRIFEAGRETFRQNTLDIMMDCPSRERAGWLCDSYFTSRVEYDLTGGTDIEHNFIQNYLLPDKFDYLPDGMLPMCYPADHNDGNFIPNWALWFVLELEEYLLRSEDRDMVDGLKSRVIKLFKYFEKYRNEFGLLEKLDGWVFIEWSKANELVQDVNYPTNMLFAAALAVAGRLYHIDGFIEEAKKIRKVICQQSFNGHFFVDNAVRNDEKLELTGQMTEVCQYYAFYFEIASPDTHYELWNYLKDNMGPKMNDTNKYTKLYKANAFIGNYLRLELLSKYGYITQLIQEIKDYFCFMAERTGTLWEHDGVIASCNHGFASHVVHILYRNVLGVRKIDKKNKIVTIRINDLPLNWCKGRMALGSNSIYYSWKLIDGIISLKLDLPEGYKVDVENHSEKKLELNEKYVLK